MGGVEQVAGQPAVKWYQNPQFWVALAALLISVVALVTRPDFKEQLGQLFDVIQAALKRMTSGIRIASPQVDPSYDPSLAREIYGVHCCTIAAFIIFHYRWLKGEALKISDSKQIAKGTLKQFTAGWLALWCGWLVLYAWFYLTADSKWQSSPVVNAVSDLLDTISGFTIWWCFLVLDLPSVKVKGERDRDRAFNRAVWLTAFAGIACALLGVADRLFDFGHLGIVVGLYNALAMAFLAGRFGSHFIGLSHRILLCLYLYSMLQLVYSFLPLLKAGVWTPAVFLLALVLKIALAYAGYDMIRNGGLERYLLAAQEGKLNTVSEYTN